MRIVADAAVDDHADAAAPLEVGQHHLAEDAAAHVAARIDDDDVAGLGVIEDMAVQLPLRVGVLALAVQVLALGHELERQRRADGDCARCPRTRPHNLGVAHPQTIQFARRGGTANVFQAFNKLF